MEQTMSTRTRRHTETAMTFESVKQRVTNGRSYLYVHFTCPTCGAKKAWTRAMFVGSLTRDVQAVCTGVKQERA